MNFWNRQGLAVIKLEFIAENYFAYQREITKSGAQSPSAERYGDYLGRNKSRSWVARIVGEDEQFGLKREFIRGQIDYSRANSVGSRGVFIFYALKPGIYEVNARESWNKVRRYFIRVENTQYVEIEEEEVQQWLQQIQKQNS